MQSVYISTKVLSSNPARGDVYSLQHSVIKVVSGFLWAVRFPPPIKINVMV